MSPTSLNRSFTLNRAKEQAIEVSLLLCALVSIATTAGIVFVLVAESVFAIPPEKAFFQEVSPWEFFTGTQWSPQFADKHFGVLPLVCGTFLIAGIAAVVGLPIGILSAVYLSEYASPRVRSIVKPILEILAGIPTVVYGFFALYLITPTLIRPIFSTLGFDVDGYNALSAGIVVGIMIIPMVSSLSEDALRAVPRSLREAGYALGSTKFDVSAKVVLPAAFSGIVASFLLAIARAVGETMAVTIAARPEPDNDAQPPAQRADDDQLHRERLARRHAGRYDRVQESLRRCPLPVFHHAGHEHPVSVRDAALPGGVPVSTPTPTADPTPGSTAHELTHGRRENRLFETLCAVSTWSTFAVLVILIVSVSYRAWGWLDWQFLTSFDSRKPERAGILAGLLGSCWMIVITIMFSVPVGVGAAVYLEEYATDNLLTRIIRTNLANLAGVPSIVYGILGLTVFVRMFGLFGEQGLFHIEGIPLWGDAGHPAPLRADGDLRCPLAQSADPSRDHRGRSGGASCGSSVIAARFARPGSHALADDSPSGPPLSSAGHHDRSDSGDLTGVRRNGSAGDDRCDDIRAVCPRQDHEPAGRLR